ncbi:hypothetical protein RP20_CCG025289 [Aedes albopictus]|nr:hypothetical protein RP20_CCG025289 [Aedes albopictus]
MIIMMTADEDLLRLRWRLMVCICVCYCYMYMAEPTDVYHSVSGVASGCIKTERGRLGI